MASIALVVTDLSDPHESDDYWHDLFIADGDTVTFVDDDDFATTDFSGYDLVAVRSIPVQANSASVLAGKPVLFADNHLPSALGLVSSVTLSGGLTHLRPHNPPFSDAPYDDQSEVQVYTSGNLYRYATEDRLVAGTIVGAYRGMQAVVFYRVDAGVVRVFFGFPFTNNAAAGFDEMLLRAKDLALSGSDPTGGDPSPPVESEPLPGGDDHPLTFAPDVWYGPLIRGVEFHEPFPRVYQDFPLALAPDVWHGPLIRGIEEYELPSSNRQVLVGGVALPVIERYVNIGGEAVRVTRYINVSGDPVEIVPGE